MTHTREEALEAASKFLSGRMKSRLEIVDSINGVSYDLPDIDSAKCWIVYVHPENLMIDGGNLYIVINRETGEITEVATS